jgi:hypothetical protein
MIESILSKYLISIYCLTGTILNFINLIIFSSSDNKIFKKPIYQYLKLNSITDGLNAFFLSISPFVLSDSNDTSFHNSYVSKLYHFYVALYIGRVLNTLSSCINIRIAYKRFITLRCQKLNNINRDEELKNVKIFSVLFLLFSVVLHSPNLFIFEIKKKIDNQFNLTNTSPFYKIEFSEIGKKHQNLVIILFVFKFIVTISNLVAISSFSIQTFIYIHQRCHSSFNDFALISIVNNEISSNEKLFRKLKHLENQTNKMILGMSTIFIINEIITTAGSILEVLNRTQDVKFHHKLFFILVIISYITNCSLNTFLYLKYCKPFADKFKQLFKLKK